MEGERIVTENLSYQISDALIKGKSRIKVEFLPHGGHRAGPVFTVRTIREKRP